METHSLVQGTDAWNAYRKDHDNASDAPAMMGCSPYKTRNELLHEVFTGLSAEIDPMTQARFDAGHRYEALARPLAEKIIGQDLYPVTGSLGRLSASFDGLTMDETIAFEHKSVNDAIRSATCGEDLPKYLRVQMEQQCMISGAERVLFMASAWDANDNLIEEVHHWYTPDPALAAEIEAGWAQFHADLAAYVPPAVIEKPVAETILALPALVVQTRGEVVTSNLPEFKLAAQAFIDRIKTDLVSDEDFVNADATVKFCEETEGKLEHAKAAALAQTASIDEVLRTIDQIREQVRAKRLQLFNLIKTKKDQIRETMLAEGKRAYAAHVADLDRELSPLRLALAAPDFAGAMKSKRTLATLQNAVDTTLAQAKIAANAVAQDWRAKLAWFNAEGAEHKFLFNDLQGIIGKPMEDFQLVVNTRIDKHKQAEAEKAEALRAQIAAQERAKAEAAVEAERQANARAAEAQRQADLKAVQDADAARQCEAAEANVRAAAQAREQELAQQRDAAHGEALQMNADFDAAAHRAIQNAQAKPTVTSAPADLLDAADSMSATEPSDSLILEVLAHAFGMNAAQVIERLERFDAAGMRAFLNLPAAGEPNITMIKVDSSQIDSIGFDAATGTLAIQFPSRKGPGSLYHYHNFTPELFEEFKAADSVGSYFAKHIKSNAERFPYEKVAA